MNRNRNLWMLVVAVGLVACGSDARAGDMPTGWRGNGAGLHGQAKPPLEWSDRQNVLWRAKVGKGNSSPVAVGGRVLLTAEPDKLICFDAATGRMLWQRTNGAADLPVELRKKDLEPTTECGYATPTPCSNGREVYALYGNGVVACYGLDGRRKWITLIDIEQTEQHGRSASPMVVGDRLMVHVSDLFCLDARTGKTLWRRAAKTAFGTPLPVRIGTVDVIVTPRGDVFRVKDGRKLAAAIASVPVASPVVHDGVVYFIGSVAQALRLPAKIEGDKLGQVRRLWRAELPGKIYASPLVHGGLIYTVTKRGKFLVLDAANGRTVRSESLKVKSECAPSPALAGRHVFLHTDAGRTFIFQPGRQGRQVAVNALGSGSVATPAFAGGRIFLRCEKALVCVQASAQPTTMTATRPSPQPSGKATTAPGSTSAFMTGWRGNWTGLYPRAAAPAKWGRIANGVLAGMTCQSARPPEGGPQSGQPVKGGLVRDWLVIGPFPVRDSVKEFAAAQIARESALAPAEGDKVAALLWKRLEIKKKPDYEVWGTTKLDWLDLGGAVGYKPNQTAYAHTYLYCRQAGAAVMVVDHGHGLKAWLNGKEVYANPVRACALGNYVGISRYKRSLTHGRSPKIRLALKKGWNRLLIKIGTDNRESWREMKFAHRLYDPDPAAYDEQNILWMTKLPERTNACPVIVGDRIFTPAEPDELICLDKATGKILWRRFHTLYDATGEADRAANPAFKEKIAPLADQLAKTTDYEKGLALRRKIRDLLVGIDKSKHALKWDGHLAAHFGIVGFTTTPVSDGKHVWAFFGHGVVACYDLAGNRKWIRRLRAKQIVYSCSPALTGGKLVCIFGGMHGLDAATGKTAWKVPDAGSIASLIPVRIAGVDAVTVLSGVIYRASDGKQLWKNPQFKHGKGGGWGAPLFLDGRLYIIWMGVSSVTVADFSDVKAEPWQPKMRQLEISTNHRRPNGEWLDRSSPASPLVHNGLYYGLDEYGVLYAVDLKTGKTLYRQETGFDELHHYNAIGVAASPTLVGKNIVVMDNQGSALVFQPGRTFKKVAMNRIETALPRDWPIPPQETLSNGPPVADGGRLYIRGEQYLYCIGKD